MHAGAKCAATKFACDVLVSLDEGTDYEVLHDDFATERGYSSSRRDKTRRRKPKPCRRPVARKGWAAGMPCSAAAARNWLRKGGVAQRLCAAPSSRPRSHVPTHCSFSHAGSPAPPRVAASAVAFLVATRRWPVRCAAGLVLLWGAAPREGRHLVSSGGLLPADTGLDTSLEQRVGRLSQDRTTVRHWQRLGCHRKYVPWSQDTRGSPRHVPLGSCCAIIISPFPSWSSTRLRRETLFGSTPAPVQSVVSTVGYPRRCSNGVGVRDDWCWSDPGNLLGVPSTPLSEGRPLLAVNGSSRGVASLRVVKSHLGSPDVVCHCGCTGDRGLFAPQSTCPGTSRRQVSHLPYTSVGLLR